MPPFRLPIPVALLCAALLFAACGDDASQSKTGSSQDSGVDAGADTSRDSSGPDASGDTAGASLAEPALFASQTKVLGGDTVELTPWFAGGTATISPDVGEVQSGQVVSVQPTATTTYTLTVTSAADTATATVDVEVVEPATLSIAFSGQAPTGATVEISGPDGYAQQVTDETTLDGLMPGAYYVSAPVSLAGGVFYYAEVDGSPADLTSGDQATVTVDWQQIDAPPRVSFVDRASPLIVGQTTTFDVRVSDPVEPASDLSVSVNSNQPTFFADANSLQITGTGDVRTLSATPSAGSGGATLTVTVTDAAGHQVSTSLDVRVFDSAVVVTSANDSGPGSLREAVGAVSDGEVITFDASLPDTLTLTGGKIAIDKPVVISGPGADVLSVTTGGSGSIFNVQSGGKLEVSGLTLTQSDSAITVADGAHLVVRDVSFVDNSSDNGAAIRNSGQALVERSLFSGNISDCGAGCGTGGGAILQYETFNQTSEPSLIARDSIFSGNIARSSGGAFGSAIAVNRGDLTLERCTVIDNECKGPNCGGGAVGMVIFSDPTSGGTARGRLTISGSIISANTGGTPADLFVRSDPGTDVVASSGGFNVLGHIQNLSPAARDITDVFDPMVSPLGDYGGAFATVVPLPGSPALGMLPVTKVDLLDARGERRRATVQQAYSDSGAVDRMAGDPVP